MSNQNKAIQLKWTSPVVQLPQALICFSFPEPPCILEKPESMNVLPGSKVQFNVLVSGTPPLTIKWFKNKKEILSSADCNVIKDNTSSSLELFFAKTSDSGEYVCEIQNDVGSTSCQTTLFVKGYHSLCETELKGTICFHLSVLMVNLNSEFPLTSCWPSTFWFSFHFKLITVTV